MNEPPLRIARHLPFEQLGPIGKMVRDRCLYDVVAIHDGLLLRCTDGLEIEIAFASDGPELKAFRAHVITFEKTMPAAFDFMRGKPLDCVYWRKDLAHFHIIAQDGHALRFDWKSGQPEARGVDVHVNVPPAPAFAEAGRL